MPANFEPSSALCTVASVLHRWCSAGQIGKSWVANGEAALAARPRPPLSPSELDIGQLQAMVSGVLRYADRRYLPDEGRFIELMQALVLLDGWHEPLEGGGPGPDPVSAAHEDCWQRLFDEGCFNSDKAAGLLIPRRCPDVPFAASATIAAVPNDLLQFTAYLPTLLLAGHPDGAGLRDPDARVSVRYKPLSLLKNDGRPLPGARPVVCVAPVLQDERDARVVTFSAPERYGVSVEDGQTRLADVVRSAMAAGGHLLFIPEMAVREEDLALLGKIVREEAKKFMDDHAALPALRYLVAGCVATPTPVACGRNYIVVIDITGEVRLWQNKLSRWNLNADQQHRYGLLATPDPAAHPMLEDIDPGREIWVADLEAIGRFATLICADMDYDLPGDFLVLNVDLDWLHAPIMDRSINWGTKPDGTLAPWVVDRAVRAARAGARRVIVTNSMLLTDLMNAVNVSSATGFAPLAECGIAFMLDADDSANLRFREMFVPVSPGHTIVEQVRWNEGFGPFPPP